MDLTWWLNTLIFPAIRSVVLILVLLTGFAYLTWYERKLLARFHVRYGPNRAGPKGLLQPIADAVKAIFKEEIIPNHVDKPVYLLAPALALVPALLIWAVIPIAKGVPAIADVPIGFLWILAIAGIESYGIILAGWSSNNNYSLLGALRSSAQMISYELPHGHLPGQHPDPGRRLQPGEPGGDAPCLVGMALAVGSCSRSSLSASWPRPTAAPLTCPKPRTSWWPVFRPNTAASSLRCSSWPSTSA